MRQELDQPSSLTESATPSFGDQERIRRWLAAMEDCVRRRHFEGARDLFASDVLGFGTGAVLALGLDALEERQWRRVWQHTRGFTFSLEQMHCFGGPDGLCVATTWESVGVRADGSTFPRSGRATLVLAGGERLKAVHSHFSLDP